MGLNTLNNRSAGETIQEGFYNDIHQAMNSDFVGRNTSGVPTANQNLGTAGIPWGTIRATQLILSGLAVDASSIVAPANRVVSGKIRGTAGSNLNQFITPNGAAASFIVDGTPTNLVLVINGVTTTISTDITKSSLTTAPSTNNTALVNDADAADQYDTRFWGSLGHRKSITIDTVGSEISGLVGKWASFKIAGTSDEYFFAYVNSATELTSCKRGFYYDSTLAPVKAAGFSNNDTITLMQTGWVFAENDGTTIDVSYRNPHWGFEAPSSPVTGDYFFNMGTNQWNRYDGSVFQVINRTFIGIVILDSTACVAARCEDSYSNFKDDNTLVLKKFTNEIVRAEDTEATVNVAGTPLSFAKTRPVWNITTDLAASADMFDATEQPSRIYYAYSKQNGDSVISDIPPYHRGDLQGRFHPYNMWRCVGIFFNDSSSDIAGANSFKSSGSIDIWDDNGSGGTDTAIRRFLTVVSNSLASITYVDDATNGAVFTCHDPGLYSVAWSSRATTGVDKAVTKNIPSGHADNATALNGISAPNYPNAVLVGSDPANTTTNISGVLELKMGDTLRMHGSGTFSGTESWHNHLVINKIQPAMV